MTIKYHRNTHTILPMYRRCMYMYIQAPWPIVRISYRLRRRSLIREFPYWHIFKNVLL